MFRASEPHAYTSYSIFVPHLQCSCFVLRYLFVFLGVLATKIRVEPASNRQYLLSEGLILGQVAIKFCFLKNKSYFESTLYPKIVFYNTLIIN